MRLLGLLMALLLALGGAAVDASASPASTEGHHAARRAVPSRARWLADVKAAMHGSRGYVRDRVATAAPGERLAVNFDIDNTVIATYYDGGGAIPVMRRFARLLHRLDVDLVFNTGRLVDQKKRTIRQLEGNGFPVAELCLRRKGERLAEGKQRCRDRFARDGYALIANVGNNATDFEGDGYERAFRLPSYGVLG
jgi:predicted secreted acid phosphatase